MTTLKPMRELKPNWNVQGWQAYNAGPVNTPSLTPTSMASLTPAGLADSRYTREEVEEMLARQQAWNNEGILAALRATSEAERPAVPDPTSVAVENARVGSRVARAMPASDHFTTAWNTAKKWETDRFVNYAMSDGGPTRYGITARSYPNEDIASMTEQRAMDIYRRDYYDPSGAGRLHPGLGLMVADMSFLSGLGGNSRILKNAFGTTNVDQINAIDPLEAITKYNAAANAYLAGLSNYSKYGPGWRNRMNDTMAIARRLEGY